MPDNPRAALYLSIQLTLRHCVGRTIIFHAFNNLRLGLHSRAQLQFSKMVVQYCRQQHIVVDNTLGLRSHARFKCTTWPRKQGMRQRQKVVWQLALRVFLHERNEPHPGDSSFEVCHTSPEPESLTVADLQGCCCI